MAGEEMSGQPEQEILLDLRSRLRGTDGFLSLGLRRDESGAYLLLRARRGSASFSLPGTYRGLRLEKEAI